MNNSLTTLTGVGKLAWLPDALQHVYYIYIDINRLLCHSALRRRGGGRKNGEGVGVIAFLQWLTADTATIVQYLLDRLFYIPVLESIVQGTVYTVLWG